VKLILIPTPIGNLEDITLRSLKMIKEVDILLAEDTRTSMKLLKHYDIKRKVEPFHKFNEHKALKSVVSRLQTGLSAGLISDAGTPGISDPGFLLIRECLQNDIDVECLPGATALIPALVNSGFPTDKFAFEGFLPQKKGRQKRLSELANEERTLVFYESPYRLLKTLQQLGEIFPEQRVSVSRELTKMHEENIQGSFSEVIDYFEQNTIKGEFVIVVEKKQPSKGL
jgi:16S rRNA (cytidine1402-2'-O)-methyltransferase